jgi:hypothetical protein
MDVAKILPFPKSESTIAPTPEATIPTEKQDETEPTCPITAAPEQETVPETVTAEEPPLPEELQQALQTAQEQIQLADFPEISRREEIREHVKATPLEKRWSRLDSIFRDAIKNHAVSTKKSEILTQFERTFAEYPCRELEQMMGAFYDTLASYPEAVHCYVKAGDYANAAAISAKESEATLMDTLGQWILSDVPCDNTVYQSFYALCRNLRHGQFCKGVTEQLLQTKPEKAKPVLDCIFYGLLAVAVNYVPAKSIQFPSEELEERISVLLQLLENASLYESSRPIPKPEDTLLPIEKTLTPEGMTQVPEVDLETLESFTGYITRTGAYGFIGKTPTDREGYFFSQTELSSQLRKYRDQLVGLKVVCRLKPTGLSGRKSLNAVTIVAAEDFDAFLERHGIVRYYDTGINPSEMSLEEQEALLCPHEDGTYSGYIVRFHGSYGFVNRDPNAAKGIYFYIGELDTRLVAHTPRILGQHIRCELEVVTKEDKVMYNAKRVMLFSEKKNHHFPVISKTPRPTESVLEEKKVKVVLTIKPTEQPAPTEPDSTEKSLDSASPLNEMPRKKGLLDDLKEFFLPSTTEEETESENTPEVAESTKPSTTDASNVSTEPKAPVEASPEKQKPAETTSESDSSIC